VVESLGLARSSPIAGDRLHFWAAIKNVGGGETPNTESLSVTFYVDGALVATVTSGPLAPGASATVRTENGSKRR
jgi:subtilase family serine protease